MGIEIQHISKSFGQFTALRDVSLSVKDGELLALLGPSGSGKTTLLRIIAGLEAPDLHPDSEIRFHGASVTRQSVGQRRVGFVFQHYALFRHMSVFENIAFGLRVRPRSTRPPKSEIRDRVHTLLRLIQLEGFGDRYPAQLSGGQRQRVALARALAVEPKVLLLDEPFGALDAKVRQGLRTWLRKLHDEIHLTSILVTHDQEEALEVADRVVVMNQARIEQVGTPDEVFHRPASRFVMEFLGQVNVFRGRLEQGRPVFGGPAAASSSASSEANHLYVRPHELQIERHLNGKSAIPASVKRINRAGALAKVELEGEEGARIWVDLSLQEADVLALEAQQRVYVSAKQARTFSPEYNI